MIDNKHIKDILSENIITHMQLDVIDWINKRNLHNEYNKFWVNYDTQSQQTGYVLIDFAIYYMSKMDLLKEGH